MRHLSQDHQDGAQTDHSDACLSKFGFCQTVINSLAPMDVALATSTVLPTGVFSGHRRQWDGPHRVAHALQSAYGFGLEL
jgi:hypothetical protein